MPVSSLPGSPVPLGLGLAPLPPFTAAQGPTPLTAAQVFSKDTTAAEAALLEAQQRIAALAAVALSFQVPLPGQTCGPALKVPPPPLVSLPAPIVSAPASYHIP